jgi:hypothetical protein
MTAKTVVRCPAAPWLVVSGTGQNAAQALLARVRRRARTYSEKEVRRGRDAGNVDRNSSSAEPRQRRCT